MQGEIIYNYDMLYIIKYVNKNGSYFIRKFIIHDIFDKCSTFCKNLK